MSRSGKKMKCKNKISEYLGVIVLLTLGLFFLIKGIQDLVIINNWDTTGISEYTGSYVLSIKESLRNTNYVFQLDNGCEVYFPSEYLNSNNDLRAFDELTFRYTSCKEFFRGGLYRGVSIIPSDREYITISEEKIKKEFIIGGIVYLLLGGGVSVLSLSPFLIQNVGTVIGAVYKTKKYIRKKLIK